MKKNLILFLVGTFAPFVIKSQTFQEFKKEDAILGFTLRSSFQDLDTTGLQQGKIKENPLHLKSKIPKRSEVYRFRNHSFLPYLELKKATVDLSYMNDRLFHISIFLNSEIKSEEGIYEKIYTHLKNILGEHFERPSQNKKGIEREAFWQNKNAEVHLFELKLSETDKLIFIQINDRKLKERFFRQIGMPHNDDMMI